jgi:large subunit ribosomal protein L3
MHLASAPSILLAPLVLKKRAPGAELDCAGFGGYPPAADLGHRWALSAARTTKQEASAMNQKPGVIGRKVGMMQIFSPDGTVIPCTVVESQSIVVAKRTREKDGYDALLLGLGERRPKRTNKPLGGFFTKVNIKPTSVLKELRCSAEYAAKFQVGQPVKLDEIFSEGQFVDVQGTSKGCGFSGVMKRYNFKGAVSTHGSHEYKRHGGSIGTNMTPGRTLPGKKMPGHMGAATTSVLSQRLVRVSADDGLLFIRGGIPGARDGLVLVRSAVKREAAKESK